MTDLKPLKSWEILVSILSGALLSLGFPGFPLPWLAWISLIPFWLILTAPRRKRDYFFLSWGMGIGLYGGLMYWLFAMHPLTWLGMDIWTSMGLVTLAWVLVSVIMSISIAIGGTLIGVTLRKFPGAWGMAFLPPLFWVAMEYLQGQGILGFTWGTVATTQYQNLPILQMVAVTGSFVLSGLVIAVSSSFASLIRHRKPLPLVVTLLAVAVAFGYGQWKLGRPIEGRSFRYALVQGNIDQTEKWSAGALSRIVDTYLSMSRKAQSAQLVVWPETAVPEFLRNNQTVYRQLAAFAKDQHQHLLTGTLDWNQGKLLKLYNSTTVFSDNGFNVGFDYKTHLVPLGEYLPFREWMPKPIADLLAGFNIVAHDYAPAERPMAFTLPFARVGTAVCFDSIFPKVVYDKVRAGAETLVVVTNDAWYKKTAAPVQHLSQSVLRAVETGRYLLRAANTGITCAVDPHGRIYSPTRLYEPAVVEGVAIAQNTVTPYVRFGDCLSWLAILGAGAALFLALWRSR